MALPLLRFCICSGPSSGLIRYFGSKTLLSSRSRQIPLLFPRVCAARGYSSEGGRPQYKQKVLVFGVPNPFAWFRTRVYFFLIRVYFDNEFNINEFTEGAKQAFAHVSGLLSKCQFEALEGLVANDLIAKLEEKCVPLPSSHQNALSADSEEILYSTVGDVGIYYDDGGRKFVSVLMRFWYLTSSSLPEDTVDGARLIHMDFVRDGEKPETKRILTANYEFQREFTQGVTPNWIITRIEHSKLLD